MAEFTHSGGTSEFSLDMSNRGGNWISLDSFDLGAGEQVSLKISNAGANNRIIADGMRISKIRECPELSTKDVQRPQFHFNLYPNPASHQFSVQLNENTQLEILKVYDSTGKMIFSTNKTTVNTSILSKGLYFVYVKTSHGEGVKKLLID